MLDHLKWFIVVPQGGHVMSIYGPFDSKKDSEEWSKTAVPGGYDISFMRNITP